jgi:hypothetical protein
MDVEPKKSPKLQPAPLEILVVVASAPSDSTLRHSCDSLSVPVSVVDVEVPATGCVDSPNDAFAAQFGSVKGKVTEQELRALAVLVYRLVEVVSESNGLGGELESFAHPKIRTHVGTLVSAPGAGRFCWVELYSKDTGEYLLPDFAELGYEPSTTIIEGRDEGACERFSAGVARVVVELSRDLDGEMKVFPWVSCECGDEAIRHMIYSMRTQGLSGASVLHAAVLRRVFGTLNSNGAEGNEVMPMSQLLQETRCEVVKLSQSTDGKLFFDFTFGGEGAAPQALADAGIRSARFTFGLGAGGDFTVQSFVVNP